MATTDICCFRIKFHSKYSTYGGGKWIGQPKRLSESDTAVNWERWLPSNCLKGFLAAP